MKYTLDEAKLEMIRTATEDEISDLILALQARYHELFPNWSMDITVLEKTGDRTAQLERMIENLQKLKNK